jgi:hypothetical protein
VGLTSEASSDAINEWEGFVLDCMDFYGGYNSANRSCQEFVIFLMYYMCHPPFFNMSDAKSLVPILISLSLLNLDWLGKSVMEVLVNCVKDLLL